MEDNFAFDYRDALRPLGARRAFDLTRVFARQPVLETERLKLRPIVLADAEDIFSIYGDAEVGKDNGWVTLPSVAAAKEKIAAFEAAFVAGERVRWGLELKSEGRIVGDCALVHFDRRGHIGEIGYNLARAYWRKGLSREAAMAVIRYGFEEIGLNRIIGQAAVENVGSLGLLQALGFETEGYLRQGGWFRDRYRDMELSALLRDDLARRLQD